MTLKIKMELKHIVQYTISEFFQMDTTILFFFFFANYMYKCTQMELIPPVLSLPGHCASS